MLFQILSLLLDVAASLVGGACLLRLYMQWQRVPFGNPLGRFVFAVSNWLVLPLRRLLPAMGRIDTANGTSPGAECMHINADRVVSAITL